MTVPTQPTGLRARLGLPVPSKPAPAKRDPEPVVPVWLQRSRAGVQRLEGVPR